MEQYKFRRNFMIWTAVGVAVVMLICGLIWGRVIEDNLFQEIAKWVVMTGFLIVIFEVFAYVLSGFFYHGSRFDPDSDKYKKLHKNDEK